MVHVGPSALTARACPRSRGHLRLVEQPPLLAVGPIKVHRHSLQAYATLIGVFQTALLAMLATSTNGVAAILTVRLRPCASYRTTSPPCAFVMPYPIRPGQTHQTYVRISSQLVRHRQRVDRLVEHGASEIRH